jgi:hypothetical protein
MGVVICDLLLRRLPEWFLMGMAVRGRDSVVGELPLDLRPVLPLRPLPRISY